MKCIKENCNGELHTVGVIKTEGNFIHNHKAIPIPKYCSLRTRKCNNPSCKAIVRTVELPVDRFFGQIEFMNDVKTALLNYKEWQKDE